MADFIASSPPAVSEQEIRRRLAACYRLLLSLGTDGATIEPQNNDPGLICDQGITGVAAVVSRRRLTGQDANRDHTENTEQRLS